LDAAHQKAGNEELMMFPNDYAERVYAGVLGKLIGVYLGRPFEGWTYDRITRTLGDITYYVHDRFQKPLIVTDDDISGTFTFLRAFADNGYDPNLTSEQIGQTWLNYLVERRTVLWWGGVGNSTEHTAYSRLKQGIPAPLSGAIATNGTTVAEQIGAQIFIDGWAMVCPGDPERAAHYADLAARVSHDGEAVYGAQVIAAMEALAFVEQDIDTLLNTAVSFIPNQSTIYRLITDIREWHAQEPDWRRARQRLQDNYGYDKYPGVCHIVPNHGVIILSLLYGEGSFDKSLTIANTSGWDTDCNSGNIGCLMAIRNGLAALDANCDWRSPIADRLYISSADGGRSITDAAQETLHIVETAHRLQGVPYPLPKHGARFHFDFPGALQGFRSKDEGVTFTNMVSPSGVRCLAIRYSASPVSIGVPTFPEQDAGILPPYDLIACPTLYPTQTVHATVQTEDPLSCCIYVRALDEHDTLVTLTSPQIQIAPGESHTLSWQIPDLPLSPIMEVGLQVSSDHGGTLYLDSLTWHGTPQTTFTRVNYGTQGWHSAWVNAMDHFDTGWSEPFRLAHNEGRGMIIQGTREWHNYRVSTRITPHMMQAGGIAAYVQGLRRYYALLLTANKVQLVKMLNTEIILAESEHHWQEEQTISLSLEVVQGHLRAWVDDALMFDIVDSNPLDGGGIGFAVEKGCLSADAIEVMG
jgi:ADP-ribosylglycohydrolase